VLPSMCTAVFTVDLALHCMQRRFWDLRYADWVLAHWTQHNDFAGRHLFSTANIHELCTELGVQFIEARTFAAV
jgi:hypothetical protein